MFNNPAIDIVIGLIFIYLLYSLLATAINEFVAMLFAYRHRMLEKGIEQMLDGKNYSYYWWDKLVNLIRWVFNWSLIQKKWHALLPGKPLSLRQFLSNQPINGAGTNTLAKSGHYIKRAKLNKKASLFAAGVINHPLYRRKSEQSILYKKPAYLSATAFSDIMTDILSGSKSSTSADLVTMVGIKAYVEENLAGNPDLKSILNLYIEQAKDDVLKFRHLLENWYDDTMQRVSGWYKRQVTKILFIIGLVLSIIFNVGTLGVIHTLSHDKTVREALVQDASAYVKKHYVDEKEPATLQDSTGFTEAKKKLQEIKSLYHESIEQNNTLLGLGWADYRYGSDTAQQAKDLRRFVKDSVAHAQHKKSFNKPPRREDYLQPDLFYKVRSVLTQLLQPRNLVGFVLTALAVSLGAPFWFDLLNKFVNVRGGGNNPAEKK